MMTTRTTKMRRLADLSGRLANEEPAAPAAPAMAVAAVPELYSSRAVMLFLALHVPLAYVLRQQPAAATIHAAFIFAAGLWAAAGRRMDRVAMVVAYVAGAEVLWRMTQATVPWEFAKYASVAVMVIALLRDGRLRPPTLTTAYFALLLPSTLLTFTDQDWSDARGQISFNLSGPLSLAVSAWFFSGMMLTPQARRAMYTAAIGPIIGIATLAVLGTVTTANNEFLLHSNFAASGGYGPNQVSAALGFAALLCLVIATDKGPSKTVRVLFAALVVAFTVQSSLTFSRGGLYMAGGAAAVALSFAASDARFRLRVAMLLVGLFIIGNFFVLPYMDAFTDGGLSARFESTNLTGRDALIRSDMALWQANPILGVGPGNGRLQRGIAYASNAGETALATGPEQLVAAHTEFARMLSEHGAFGLIAMLLLGIAATMNIRRETDTHNKALTAGLIAWSMLFAMSEAMRVFLPSFTFGLAFTLLQGDAPGAAAALATAGASGRRRLRSLTSGHPAPLTSRERARA
jgi:hypothetical protein